METPAELRIGKEDREKGLALKLLHKLLLAIEDFYHQRHLPNSEMGCASEARVVSSESHLHHVKQALVKFAAVNQALAASRIDMQMAG